MTYPTVNNVVTDAAGNPVANATVVISLVGAPAFSTDVQAEIINTAAVYTDATGKWSTTLKPNTLITPSGTYYLVQEPGGVNWTIVVPNDTATHTLQSLLVVGPNPPAGLPGVVRYDQAQTLSGPQQTQALANIGGATAASVTAETTRAQNAEALRAQLWAPATAYTAGQPVLAPDGTTLSRIASGTSRASFDSTEQAAWNVVATKAGTLEQAALSATYGPLAQPGMAAYAENISGQTTPGTGPGLGTPVNGCTIYIPSSNGFSVDIDFGCQFGISTAGQGSGGLLLSEWTGGAFPSLPLEFAIHHFDSAVAVTSDGPTVRGHYHLGVVTAPRYFILSVQSYPEGSGLVVYARNGGAANASYGSTWMEAVAR
ncbi:MAG: hypothetical protein NVS3B21_29440 [Acidimicrobiales bacterium]